jgi:hypothetical protein
MIRLIVFAFFASAIILLGGCKSEDTRPYDPISTADGPGTSIASESANAGQTAGQDDPGQAGLSNFEAALSDTSYTQDKIPAGNKSSSNIQK